jgi:hypothetical protein
MKLGHRCLGPLRVRELGEEGVGLRSFVGKKRCDEVRLGEGPARGSTQPDDPETAVNVSRKKRVECSRNEGALTSTPLTSDRDAPPVHVGASSSSADRPSRQLAIVRRPIVFEQSRIEIYRKA